MKIHDRIWWVARTGNENLAYMTYAENNKACEKRKETGFAWAGAAHVIGEADNTPVTGFDIVDSVSRWTTQNKLFRVQDPRGFTVEVPTGNISTLLKHTTVINGVVQEPCVWGYSNSNHILLPVGSPEYQEAEEHTRKLKTIGEIKISDVAVGQEITIFENGHESTVVYLGTCRRVYSASYRKHTGWPRSAGTPLQTQVVEDKPWHVTARCYGSGTQMFGKLSRAPKVIATGQKILSADELEAGRIGLSAYSKPEKNVVDQFKTIAVLQGFDKVSNNDFDLKVDRVLWD